MNIIDTQLSFDFNSLRDDNKDIRDQSPREVAVVSLDQVREQKYRLQVLERVKQARIFDTSDLVDERLEG